MNEDPSRPEPAPSAEGAKAEERALEAAAIRRRWITLGEGLAVVALVISALTLWNSWTERRDSEAGKTAEARQASARAATLVLVATATSDRKLSLKPTSDDQSVQSQEILFPTALVAPPAQTTGEPRVEAAWFEQALIKARSSAGLPDNSRGDERLPVAIVTHFLVNGDAHEDVAVYDVGYSVSGRFVSGHSVTLRGLSLVSRAKRTSAQAVLDARWTKLFPRK